MRFSRDSGPAFAQAVFFCAFVRTPIHPSCLTVFFCGAHLGATCETLQIRVGQRVIHFETGLERVVARPGECEVKRGCHD